MSRTFRQARRAVPVLPVAALSLLAIGGSAHAAGTCPDPFVAATVNIGGTTGPGCRAIFTRFNADGTFADGERFLTLPNFEGTTTARILAVGAGQGGALLVGSSYAIGVDGLPIAPLSGGAGGAGGEAKERTVQLRPCRKYQYYVGLSRAHELDTLGGDKTLAPAVTGSMNSGFKIPGFNFFKEDVEVIASGAVYPSWAPPNFGSSNGNGSNGGGGGGASVGHPGGNSDPASYSAGPPITGTGGAGSTGVDMSAQFPGLAGANHLGAGGGGAGLSVGGAGGPGGGNGATIDWVGKGPVDATSGEPNTGGGGGGGFQFGPGVGTHFYAAPGAGADGVVVVDIPELAGSTPCGASGGGSSSGGGAGATSLKATKPKVAAAGTVINTSVTSPGAGTAVLTGRLAGAPKRLVCTATRPFTGTGTARMTCVPGAGVQRLRRTKAVRVTLAVAFRPAAGGAAQTVSLGSVTLPKVKVRPIAVTG